MARLHEYQGKAILSKAGITVPRGRAASTPADAEKIARELGGPVVIKIQAWTTGRAALGGIAFADSPGDAATHAARLLGMKVGQFPVTHVLVEEKLALAQEFFISLSIDDRERSPVMLIAASGGSGVEERAEGVRRLACETLDGPVRSEVAQAIASGGAPAAVQGALVDAAMKVFAVARACEARSVEINPLAVTKDGSVVAADCRITVDDYAVFRHPELGIDIARELDHPPTELERIAYLQEQEDHRGTFYFAQLATAAAPGSRGLIGFHGAGGGGSMMSMDAITNEGFTIANFTDTSGNPSPAKVYRAARIILAQGGLVGYFGSGSGVASQEQYWSAYGLSKAFWEMNIDIPVVIRLGGNTEDRAVEILQSACRDLPATVEGYRKTDPPARIAARFALLVSEAGGREWKPRSPRMPSFVGAKGSSSIPVRGGRVWIDPAAWRDHASAVIARASGWLRAGAGGAPEPTIGPDEFLGRDSDMIACEVECRRDGIPGFFVELDIPGLDAMVATGAK